VIDRFANPWALTALVAIPAVMLLLARQTARGLLMSDLRLFEPLTRSFVTQIRWVPSALRLLAIALLIVAVARPQRRAGATPSTTEGIAIQLVVDRSGSMAEPFNDTARDESSAAPDGSAPFTKLDAVKRLVRQFVLGDGKTMQGRPNDLIGLVTFARFADTVCPLARSPEILVQLTEQTRVANGRNEDGTAIGDGLALAAARLRAISTDPKDLKTPADAGKPRDAGSPDESANARSNNLDAIKDGVIVRGRVVILLTDGQNNAGDVDPMQAAELAKSWGLRVYTIGLEGTPPGSSRDPFANLRASMGGVDEATLRRIAEMTGGQYFSASDSATLRDVYATIDKIEKSRLSSPETALYAELFSPLAIAGILLIGAELLLSSSILRRLP